MTNASIGRNASDSSDMALSNITTEKTQNKNIIEENCSPGSLTTNLTCDCNETSISNEGTRSEALINLKNSDNVIDSVDKESKVVMNKGENNKHDTKKMADSDTVFKYVYQKNEQANKTNKTTGHSKNSLRRKKRSVTTELVNTKAPLIVNYETLHNPQSDREIWLPAKHTANIIKSSDLADFNIETLHENNDGQLDKNVNEPSTNTNRENTNDSNESDERENYTNKNVKPTIDSGESNESSENNENSGESNQYPQSNEKYSDTQEKDRKESTSNEEDSNSSIELNSTDTEKGKDIEDSPDHEKFKSIKHHDAEDESVENSSEESDHNDKRYRTENKEQTSEENPTSNQEAYQLEPGYKHSRNLPTKIQDVDLGECERIQVNKNGEIETANETNENADIDQAVEIISTSKPYKNRQNDKISALPKETTDSFSVESNEHNEPTHINDGEVKPVVEINSENDSTESSENSNESLKSKLESESLETLTGVNEKDSAEKSDKLQEEKQVINQGDVKQQFERIPLNYNHSDKKQNKDIKVTHVRTESEDDKVTDEGTLDTLKPRYDDNLNIKFDDIQIKLPEIKLPDDILSYAFENPPVYKSKDNEQESPIYYQSPSIYNKNKEEQVEKPTYYQELPIYKKYTKDNKNKEIPRFYHYSDEVKDEPRAQIKHEDDDDDDESNENKREYYGYYPDKNKKEDYKQKQSNDEENDDDLYEKFVRERFGKRGTFEKRLEKLTDYKAQNPHLYKKVENILKKTEDVKAEAVKSGDPKAGYMWTLEYGEKL